MNTAHATAARLAGARFYAILDTGYTHTDDRWEGMCRALLAAPADIIQLRAKEKTPAERRRLLERILPLFEGSEVPLVVNDDIDLALDFPRVGLHVGQDDTPVIEARTRLGDDRVLGLSTHSPEQAAEANASAGILSYFAVGPVYATPTKPSAAPVGLELVRTVAEMRPILPWFCIGGVKQGNLDEVRAAGGERFVAVSEVLEAPDPAAVIRRYRERLA